MRILIIISVVIAIVAISFYIKVKDIADKIDYKFKIRSIDGDLNTVIAYFATKDNKSNVSIAYTLQLINKSFISVMIRDIDVTVYYQGDMVADTPDGTPNNYLDVTAGNDQNPGISEYNSVIKVFANTASFNLFTAYATGKEMTIDYTVKAKYTFLRIPYTYKGSYTFKK